MVTVITKTIGSGKDYASFTLAEADVENIGTSADLVANDEAIVFEADAATYSESVTFSSTLTTDATRNVTYKPASGAEHGGDFSAGVILSGLQKGFGFYQHMIGLHLSCTGGFYTTVTWGGSGWVFDACLTTVPASSAAPIVFGGDSTGLNAKSYVRNCVSRMSPGTTADALAIVAFSYQGPIDLEIQNCTAIGTPNNQAWQLVNFGDPISAKFVNCLHLGDKTYAQSGAATVTGSNNFGGATQPFPVAIQGSPYPITATTSLSPGPGDWAIYDATNGALIDDPDNDVLAGGVGPSANSDVPTTDIVGNTRSGATTDPGAFEISTLTPPAPALITIMRQIYQQDASFSVGASSAGVEKITHQLGPASADYFTINSTTSATVSVPRTAHALRVICVVAAKACDVTLDLDASNSVFLGSIGGVASVQTDLTYFWSFGQVVSDGTYPRVRIVNDGFAGDQNVYLWWHLA